MYCEKEAFEFNVSPVSGTGYDAEASGRAAS